MSATSTFGQRFLFARDYQRLHRRWTSDADLARELGFSGSSEITGYKKRLSAPPADRVLTVARTCGVDPGWLAFGAESAAPEPEGFARWLENQKSEANVAETDPFGDGSDAGIPAAPVEAFESADEEVPAKKRRRNR